MRGSLRPVARTKGSASELPAVNATRQTDATWTDSDHREVFILPPRAAHGRIRQYFLPCVSPGSARSSARLRESKTRRVVWPRKIESLRRWAQIKRSRMQEPIGVECEERGV